MKFSKQIDWNIKIFYNNTDVDHIEFVYDDTKDIADTELRQKWESNGNIERGNVLR